VKIARALEIVRAWDDSNPPGNLVPTPENVKDRAFVPWPDWSEAHRTWTLIRDAGPRHPARQVVSLLALRDFRHEPEIRRLEDHVYDEVAAVRAYARAKGWTGRA